MIVQPINVDGYLIEYPDLDITDYRSLVNKLKDIDKHLNIILDEICFYDGRLMSMTDINDFNYKRYCSHYYWLILHINNYIEYNKRLDDIIKIHRSNVEYFNKPKVEKVKPKITKIKNKNKYYKFEVNNIFTGEKEYDYINPVIGDKITSKDANLLDSLNTKPKKEKSKSYSDIPLSHMVFNLNIKK